MTLSLTLCPMEQFGLRDPFHAVLNVTSPQKKQKKSQGSSRYRTGGDVELTALPLLKGEISSQIRISEPFFLFFYLKIWIGPISGKKR